MSDKLDKATKLAARAALDEIEDHFDSRDWQRMFEYGFLESKEATLMADELSEDDLTMVHAWEAVQQGIREKLEEMAGAKMWRATILECDWKDELTEDDYTHARVNGCTFFTFYAQDSVDSRVTFASNRHLYDRELDALWEAGDLHLRDTVFEGEDFAALLKAVKDYADQQE